MMAQRGVHLNWGKGGRRNAGQRENIGEDLLQRLEAIESRLLHEDSEEEPEVPRCWVGAIDPSERLIEASLELFGSTL